MGLREYNAKRRFDATPEPRGRAGGHVADAPAFVVQLHHASVRHFDFRLEVDGVLRSWSVPKGPSLRPGERRLAVQVEDHPLDYAGFSGIIPEGQYGTGHVAIFDSGTWRPDGDPVQALDRGKLEFELFGTRLKGRWNLIRTRSEGSKPHWLLLKRSDDYAADLDADDLLEGITPPPADAPGASTARGLRIRAEHVHGDDGGNRAAPSRRARGATTAGPVDAPASRRPVSRASKPAPSTAATSATRASRRGATASPGKRRADDAAALVEAARALAGRRRLRAGQFVAPMLTVTAHEAPDGPDWIHEWKWDGYRIVAESGDRPVLWSRNAKDWTGRVPEIERALAALPVRAVLDGELIAVDAQGYSDFNALQRALMDGDTGQLRYVVFDLLGVDGHDVTGATLLERQALLQRVLAGADPRLFFSGHVRGHGPQVFEAARDRGMEGIISKRADSTYTGGRSELWRKIKTQETRDYIVVGFTPPKGARKGFGALLLAERTGGRLRYVGRVGSGFNTTSIDATLRRLRPLVTDAAPVELPKHTPLSERLVTWVRPDLVAEVVFRGWGKEGLLRQATFHRLREDKAAADDTGGDEPAGEARARGLRAGAKATARVPADAREPGTRSAPAWRASTRIGRSRDATAAAADLPALSSPERVVYPDAGYTKRDVYDYYLSVADRLLPELQGRLLSVVRCPGGIEGPHFFQKHAGKGFPAGVHSLEIVENDGDRADYFYVDDLAGLMGLVQMNAIEFHPWGSRIDALETPDRIVFDLDPDPGIGWEAIRQAAIDVRDRLREVGLPSYPRLSGGKGVHVVAPLKPQADWDQVRRFCEAFAETMAAQEPQRFVATMSKAKRRGRIFIDWLRNGRGATSVCGWSLRARPGAPVAMPLDWDTLEAVPRPARFTLSDAADRPLPALVDALTGNAPALPL